MRPLISIMSCHAHRRWQQQLRETWLKECPVDYRFFLGSPGLKDAKDDEVLLDAPDTYEDLSSKVQAAYRWVVAHGYNHTFKCDVDTYVCVPRLLRSGFEGHDHIGQRGVGGNNQPYGGSGYWLSRRALEFLASAPCSRDTRCYNAEDWWVWATLSFNSVCPTEHDGRYSMTEGRIPLPTNDIITYHPHTLSTAERLAGIRAVHEQAKVIK